MRDAVEGSTMSNHMHPVKRHLERAINDLPREIQGAYSKERREDIVSVRHATKANGDHVIVIKRGDMGGGCVDRWTAKPAPSSTWFLASSDLCSPIESARTNVDNRIVRLG
jgi:hypothetical protein